MLNDTNFGYVAPTLKSRSESYGNIAKLIHWLMAGLFLLMFAIAYTMINIPRSDFMFALYDFHKATGLLLFMLVSLRLTWRWLNPQPALVDVPRWQQVAAKLNIYLLYALMFLLPMAGFLTSTLGNHVVTFYHLFYIQPLANNAAASRFFSIAHEYLAYTLVAAFTLHVLAALHHHYVKRDDVLRRMWIGK